jgi:restriction endonuclease S subunit
MNEEQIIPNGWSLALLEDVLDYIQPTAFIVSSTEYNDKYQIPVLTAGKSFLLGYTNETNGVFRNLPAIIFDDFTTAIKWVNFPFKVKSSAMKILVPTHSEVNLKYAYYYMETLRINTDTHKRYWISIGSKIQLPFAPVTEQHRIVAKIEELFSSLDKGIESLKTAQEQLKVYRQAVLKWAFEGKLNNKDIAEGQLPAGWTVKALSEVSDIKRGKSKHRPRDAKELYGGQYPFIQTGDVRAANGGIIRKYTQMYSDLGLKQSKLWPKDTLCLTIAANIGETAFLGFDACFPDSVVGVMAKSNTDIRFINFFIQSFKQQLNSKASATAQKNINVDFLEKVRIPVPSTLSEQHTIVSEIESRLSVCDKIEESIDYSLQEAEALRQSILKKAFEGKLVPQDPNDEHATVLLEKIKAEKLAAQLVKKELPKKKTSSKKKAMMNG